MAKVLISFPDDFLTFVDEYCAKYNFERSEFIRSAVREKVFALQPSVPPQELPVEPKPNPFDFAKTEKIVKETKKQKTESGLCPHFITKGGICRPCGGIAK